MKILAFFITFKYIIGLMIIQKFSTNDLEAVVALFYDSMHTVANRYYNPVQIETCANQQTINRDSWLKNLSVCEGDA